MGSETKYYVGTKVVLARPMNKLEYNTYRGWKMPHGEDPAEEGYLVEYLDGGNANHPMHGGYISWSPKDVFERSYHSTMLDFSLALKALKSGKKVAREGWNGKGMFIYLVPGNRYAPTTKAGDEIAAHHEDGLVPYGAYIAMKTAQHNVVPWLASQTDVLADDWLQID